MCVCMFVCVCDRIWVRMYVFLMSVYCMCSICISIYFVFVCILCVLCMYCACM